jgi:Flp pilus assembly pilin Flp
MFGGVTADTPGDLPCDSAARITRCTLRKKSSTERQHPAMRQSFLLLWSEEGQDIAEYAVMVAVILLIVVGTLRLIGSNSNTVFSSVASAIG